MFYVLRPSFGMVNEGGILHLVSGYWKFKLVAIRYDEQSSPVDKPFKLSNHNFIRPLESRARLEERLPSIN